MKLIGLMPLDDERPETFVNAENVVGVQLTEYNIVLRTSGEPFGPNAGDTTVWPRTIENLEALGLFPLAEKEGEA